MEANQARPQNMIETTDALEAVSACQSMKNFLFTLILIGLFVCQSVFLMDHFGLVTKKACPKGACSTEACSTGAGCPKAPEAPSSPESKPQTNAPLQPGLVFLAATADSEQTDNAETAVDKPAESIEQSVEAIVESATGEKPEEQVILENQTDPVVDEAAPSEETAQDAKGAASDVLKQTLSLFHISDSVAKTLVTICNYVILMAAVLYSLCLLVCLKISLSGRLGGINHIARAFFVSLFLLVVLIPWQTVLPGVLIGALWKPAALWCPCWERADNSLLMEIMMYLRFSGLWLVALWLLLWTQVRSGKWARATLRRLGVVR